MTNRGAEDATSQLLLKGMAPAVSVGLPVYNGARYLERALETLLAQRFESFELIISDNASTDATPEICQRYAVHDSRVRYSRSSVNRGASWNFNHVSALARAELFAWAAHDDEWHPDFLDRCVGTLRQRPDAVACYSRYRLMDDQGIAQAGPDVEGCAEPSRRERWNHVLRHWELCGSVYAVMRTWAIRQTRGMLACVSADLVLMSELLLWGGLVILPDSMHLKRLRAEKPYRSQTEVMMALSPDGGRPWRFHRYGVLREELAGLRYARLHRDEERTLVWDACAHYVTSRSWLYDARMGAKKLFGED